MSAPEYQVVDFKHELSGEEKREIADEIVEKLLKVKKLEEEKKEFDKDINEEIKSMKTVIGTCTQKYRDGFVVEQRNCEVRRNFTDKTIEFVDPQSGEVLRERPMTREESQMSFTVVGRDEEDRPIVQRAWPVTGDR